MVLGSARASPLMGLLAERQSSTMEQDNPAKGPVLLCALQHLL